MIRGIRECVEVAGALKREAKDDTDYPTVTPFPSGGTRPHLRAQFRPVGYTSPAATFMPADADEYYAWYVMRFFNLYGAILRDGLPLTAKYVDNYLLWMADSSEAQIVDPTGAGAGSRTTD